MASDDNRNDRTRQAGSVELSSEKDPPTTLSKTLSSGDFISDASLIDNRFAIERELGRGGFGVTYLALDLADSQRRVVIKALLDQPDAQTRAWIEQHFSDEVKALSRIDHPGVVRLVASGEMPDKRPYLAMEFVEGYDLHSQIAPEKGIGDFERIARVVRELGAAISAAHDKGVYHRDLKPENIMLYKESSEGVEKEHVKVIDFGISTVRESFDEKTRATVLAGSVNYMAPEQLQGKPSSTTDIYALGVIAYEMVTGRVPFNPDIQHPMAAMLKLLEMQRAGVRVRPQDLRASLPSPAQEIILKALSFNPADRYQRADQFGNELARALTQPDFQEEVREESPPQLTAKSATRKTPVAKILAASGALIVIAILALVGWLYLSGGSKGLEGSEGDAPARASSDTPVRSHTISYWGELQSYRDNRPVGKPIKLTGGISGETYFREGDGIRFFVESTDNGHLYLLNEAAAASGNQPQYNILFPSPAGNNLSSSVRANDQVATSENVFDAKAGTEKVWIIFSVEPVAELEDAVRRWANKEDAGEIKDAATSAFVRGLLDHNREKKLQVSQDQANERISIQGAGDTLVYLLNLKHIER